MSRTTIWSVLVFTVFAFASAIVFFWIRDGSLREAGASMDNLLSDAGSEISETTGEIVDNTGATIERATDGDDRT
jgi:hypothetical protein